MRKYQKYIYINLNTFFMPKCLFKNFPQKNEIKLAKMQHLFSFECIYDGCILCFYYGKILHLIIPWGLVS